MKEYSNKTKSQKHYKTYSKFYMYYSKYGPNLGVLVNRETRNEKQRNGKKIFIKGGDDTSFIVN